ncbi:MAG TPA: CHAT domain-containing protein, partial [Saprospiraceae bacterium]|nr:CHAT domain-containing protein [Saprospiraceae bacterium]HPI08842.1 CHAT domain-containing protein [Saprospiraceae bacterium]
VFQYESSKLGLQSGARQREEAAMQICRQLYERTGLTIYLEKGFEIAERTKAAVLLEALRDNLIGQKLRNNPQYKMLSTLRQTAAWYRKQLILEPQNEMAGQWRSDLDELTGRINTLRNSIPELNRLEAAASKHPGTPPGTFSSGENWVEYFVGAQFVEIFSGKGTTASAWNRLPNDEVLQVQVQKFQSFFSNASAILNDPAGYLQTAFLLHQKLLPDAIPASTQLLIIPDGFTHFIPFEALVTEMTSNRISLRNASYLIRKRQIRYAWSLRSLQEQAAMQSQATGFFLGVAPLFENRERGLSPLPASREEWIRLGQNSDQLIGNQAVAASFLSRAGNYRILHLSTHAFAGTDPASPPRIELFDQALLLPDIYALSLQSDLVVLSACETGIGAEQKGEGVMSLSRAFAQAGAAGIISSLWTVNDRTTSLIFRDFYQLIGDGETTGTALRLAKLRYLENDDISATQQSPYFWAGLVEVGADRKITDVDMLSIFQVTCILLGIVALLCVYLNRRRIRAFFKQFV